MWSTTILIFLGVAGMGLAAVLISKMFIEYFISVFKDFRQWAVIKYQRAQWLISTWFYLRRQAKGYSNLKIGTLFLNVKHDNL